jgi:uncharacterized protein YkwD
MNIAIFIRIFKVKIQSTLKTNQLLRSGLALLFALSLLLTVGLKSGYAQRARAAIVQTVTFGNGDRDLFRLIRTDSSSSEAINNIPPAQRRIEERGGLSIPNDGESLASFRFESAQEYGGLIVQTRPMQRVEPRTTDYLFPCQFRGQWIIAWPSNANARTCDNRENGRIQIVRDPGNLFSSLGHSSELAISSLTEYNNKQNTSEASSDSLVVSPGSEGTVIRTTANPYTEYRNVVERCDEAFVGDYCQRRIPVQKEAIDIEVLEGDILVESERNPEGARVREGQRYSYPNGQRTNFDVGAASLSCETLRFLNSAYWIDSDTPQGVATGIAEQLKQHRESLGISGRPASNLTALEQSIVNELNRLRTSPGAYADELERQKRFYYENWLKLAGETIDPSLRVSAVDEAIAFVRSQRILSPFSVSIGMSRASRDHVNDQGRTGRNFGHTGDDRSGYWDRLRRYGTVGCADGENVSYYDPSLASSRQSEAQVAVAELLINDGQRQGGDRDDIFNPDFQVMGVACGSHGPFLREMCDITYAAGFVER